jgi:hypothetical protein
MICDFSRLWNFDKKPQIGEVALKHAPTWCQTTFVLAPIQSVLEPLQKPSAVADKSVKQATARSPAVCGTKM